MRAKPDVPSAAAPINLPYPLHAEADDFALSKREKVLVIKELFLRCRRSDVARQSSGPPNRGNTAMSKKAAEHHKQSAEHHTHAARHHGEAAKHHEAGQHEKAAHHAHTARGHALHARHHSDEAAKSHMEEHGKK